MRTLHYMTDSAGCWWYGFKVAQHPINWITTGSTEWPTDKRGADKVEYFYDPAVTQRPTKPKELPIMIKPLDLSQFIVPPLDLSAFAPAIEYTPFVEVSQQKANDVTETGRKVLPEMIEKSNFYFSAGWNPVSKIREADVPPLPPHNNEHRYFSLDDEITKPFVAELTAPPTIDFGAIIGAPEQVETPPVAIGTAPAIPFPADNLPALTERFAPAEHTPWHPYDREVPGQYGYYEVRCRTKSGSEFSAFSCWRTDSQSFNHDGDVEVFAWRGLTEAGHKLLSGA